MDSKAVMLVLLPLAIFILLFGLLGDLRIAFKNGWRVLGRYGDAWKLPFAFGLAYGVFLVGQHGLLLYRLQTWDAANLWDHQWAAPADPWYAFRVAWLPAFENATSIYGCLVVTFPLSCIFGLLLLANFQNCRRELSDALRKRTGSYGPPILFLCAAAAILKPAVYLGLPELSHYLPLTLLMIGAGALNLLSALFEFLLGVYIQVFLLLTAFAWIKGMDVSRRKLLHFALRRFAFVAKWAFLLLAINLVFLQLPLLGINLLDQSDGQGHQFFDLAYRLASLLLGLLMLSFATVQVGLALHNESLGKAISDHLFWMRYHGWKFAGFFLASFCLLLATGEFFAWALGGFTNVDALLPITLRVLQPAVTALLSGWILAAWVVFYFGLTSGKKEIAF